VLPYWGGTYSQMPFEDITKEKYESIISKMKSVDLTKIIEMDDNVEFGQTNACSGGSCNIE
jgi:hypothetical protein